ncbi:pilus assembly protein [Hydrogenophaga sp.]|uniref:pilus assembly protein n=1 Tax=Hydrogenophaga sp. TaxID=1904254 RepID=UPI00272F004C|nr:PilC/PilY family type IV pilus protein [Hydrogenophaga sp.]MDP1686749.1 PilC/PilY family type IV pilus protein [Hydrogenophaga sp.]
MKTNRILKLGALTLIAAFAAKSGAFTPSQQPPDTTAVPGNVVLALSVEFPTATQASYPSPTYSYTVRYEGYFDNRKCYTYSTLDEVFTPVSAQNTSTGTCPVATQWAGNLLNWLTMSNLDQFRSVMTGGTRDSFSSMSTTHPGDTTGRTVLIRTYGSQQGSDGNNPVRNLTVGTPGMPLTGVNKFARSFGYGSKFIVSNANIFVGLTLAQQKATCSATPLPGVLGSSSCFNIRVEACVAVPGVGLEANCQNKYSGVPKPEGLIQQYNTDMRFAALGYLNVASGTRNGAALRSAMKSVGPNAATKIGVVPNTAPEWDTTTGIMFTNPDPADALASVVPNSGLMNYLNKFGYSGTYETYDNVSELYYASQLYLRGRAPPPDYSNNLTPASIKDDFPVITGNNLLRAGSRDPMINTCQKNYILGIGDINTHCDGNLPGSTNTNCSPGVIPPDTDGVNVQTLFNTIRGYEGLAANGVVGVGGGSGLNSGNTPYIASLAFWGNTTDIRDDLSGTQNIRTYWVDVLEAWNGTIAAASLRKTQYWLATKYGGFDTTLTPGNNPNVKIVVPPPLPPAVATPVPVAWDKDADGVPDNWFAGSNPAAMRTGLSQAFKSIADDSAASASSAAVSSSRETSSSQTIYAGYSPKDWSGTVRACKPTQSEAQCETLPDWEASRWLRTKAPLQVATPLTESTRKIFTSQQAATFTKMPFRWTNLNPSQQAVLNATDSLGTARLDFLRGKRTDEGSTFRVRAENLLGDIVNSGVTYVAGSSPAYTGSKFPGHATYRNATKTRPPVVYVGSNDGMLHAFSGVDGKELFGYIPGSVFSNLPSLTNLAFTHQYFVDSTPMAGDFEKSAGVWGTMLVGGLGAGGRGFYALDISDQSNFATSDEGTLATTPLWEFTSAQDADVGFTFNEPSINPITGAYLQIAKVADATEVNGVWRVVMGNGYGSTNGNAVLFMLDANTGAASTKLTAAVGSANGLSTPTPVDADRDGLVDTVYAGDTRGNMHKFQFSVPQGVDFVLAKAGDSLGQWRYVGTLYTASTATIPSTREPITTAPSVVPACDGVGWNVSFGTGKLNEDIDYGDKTLRGVYSVVDKSPSSSLTVSSSDLGNITFTETAFDAERVRRDWVTPNLNGKRGWKATLSDGERVLSNPTLPPDTGVVLFGTTRPRGDICTPGNTGFNVTVNVCSGASGDLLVNGIAVGGISVKSSGIIKVSNSYTDSTNKQSVVCNQAGCRGNETQKLSPAVAPRGRYNWREILTK